jgi:DNA-binding transcriptional regulator YiaG
MKENFDKIITELYNPDMLDYENAINIGVSVYQIEKWRGNHGIPKLSKKEQTDKRIARLYNPDLSDRENVDNIGICIKRLRVWKKENNISKPSKKLRTDKKIAERYNPELSNDENAAIIGVNPNRLRQWRGENNIKESTNKKMITYKAIEDLYDPNLNDADNAAIIGIKACRVKQWKKENPETVERIRSERECLNVIAQNKEITDENIAKKYNTNMTADENAINIGISPSRMRMWKRDNPDKVETIEQKILRLYNPELGWRKNAETIGHSWLTIKKYVKKNKQTAKSAAY